MGAAAKLVPTDVGIRVELARVCSECGRHAEAASEYETAIALSSASTWKLRTARAAALLSALEEAGGIPPGFGDFGSGFADAVSWCQTAAPSDVDAVAAVVSELRLASEDSAKEIAVAAQDSTKEAAAASDEAEAAEKKPAEVRRAMLMQLGTCHAMVGAFDAAALSFGEAAALRRDAPSLFCRAVAIAAARASPAVDCGDALDADALHVPSLYAAAHAAEVSGDFDRAEFAFQALVDAAPADGRGHLGLAVLAERRGDPKSAAAHFGTSVECLSSGGARTDEACLLLGRALTGAGDTDRAVDVFTHVNDQATDPRYARRALAGRGAALWRLGRHDEAVRDYRAAEAHARCGTAVLVIAVANACRTSNSELAAAVAASASPDRAVDAICHVCGDRALSEFAAPLPADPRFEAAVEEAGMALTAATQQDESGAGADAHASLGVLHELRGRPELAARHYEVSLAAEHGRTVVALRLSYVLGAGTNGTSVAAYARAVATLPEAVGAEYLLREVAAVRARGGQHAEMEVRKVLQRVATMKPGFGRTHILLGESYLAGGHIAQAAAAFRTSTSCDGSRKDRLDALRSLSAVLRAVETPAARREEVSTVRAALGVAGLEDDRDTVDLTTRLGSALRRLGTPIDAVRALNDVAAKAEGLGRASAYRELGLCLSECAGSSEAAEAMDNAVRALADAQGAPGHEKRARLLCAVHYNIAALRLRLAANDSSTHALPLSSLFDRIDADAGHRPVSTLTGTDAQALDAVLKAAKVRGWRCLPSPSPPSYP